MKVFSLALRASVAALCIGAAYVATRPRTAAAAETDTDPTVIRSRYMAIDVNTLRGPSDRRLLREPPVTLQLFPDVTIVGTFDRYDPNPDGMTWVGHVEGVPASFITLVYSGGLMAGSIVTPDALYQIRPASAEARAASSNAALHVVSEIEQAAFLREAPPIDVRFSDADRAAAAQTPMTDTSGVIDVMVLYTALAAANAGGSAGITNLINLGVSETNTSYANSGVAQRIRLVYSAQVPYAEVSGFSTNLTNLRNGNGALSGVAALRETHHADLVTMLVHPTAPDACGIAFLMTSVTSAFASSAFSVSDTTCVSPNYSFAHELGHNMGARHDWFVDTGTTPFTYAHGHVNAASTQRWRTIMAYPDQCTAQGFSCTRLLFWANPQTKYLGFCGRGTNCDGLQYWSFPGVPMGIAAGTSTSCPSGNTSTTNCDADDSRTLNDSALTVANFRQSS
jgi:peptidyl-Asp metalloendopeptidase